MALTGNAVTLAELAKKKRMQEGKPIASPKTTVITFPPKKPDLVARVQSFELPKKEFGVVSTGKTFYVQSPLPYGKVQAHRSEYDTLRTELRELTLQRDALNHANGLLGSDFGRDNEIAEIEKKRQELINKMQVVGAALKGHVLVRYNIIGAARENPDIPRKMVEYVEKNFQLRLANKDQTQLMCYDFKDTSEITAESLSTAARNHPDENFDREFTLISRHLLMYDGDPELYLHGYEGIGRATRVIKEKIKKRREQHEILDGEKGLFRAYTQSKLPPTEPPRRRLDPDDFVDYEKS